MSARTHLHVLTLALLAALMVAPVASPHRLKCATTGSLPSITCLRHEEMHATYTLAWFHKHEMRGLSTTQVTTIVRNHRWLYQNAKHWIAVRTPKSALSPYGGVPGWFVSAADCIHQYEGAWNDTGNPYWGGMQFLLSTWYASGGRGLPSAASPSVQISVAYVNWKRAGGDSAAFHSQWPVSSRRCGL